MSDLLHILRREFIYLWYYFDVQLRQIFWYWVLGIAIGSFISVFAKDGIHNLFRRMQGKTCRRSALQICNRRSKAA